MNNMVKLTCCVVGAFVFLLRFLVRFLGNITNSGMMDGWMLAIIGEKLCFYNIEYVRVYEV